MSRKSEEEEVQVQQTMLTLPQRNMIEDVTSVCSKRKMERKKREGDPTYGSEPCSVFVLSKIMFSICCEILKSDGSFF